MRKPARCAVASGRGLAATAALCLMVGLGLGAAPARAGAMKWPKGIERPPIEYLAGPTQYGDTKERSFSDRQQLQDFCDFYLGKPRVGAYEACYIPAMDLVVLPDAAAWPDAVGREALRQHEWAHARGWRHPVLSTAATDQRRR